MVTRCSGTCNSKDILIAWVWVFFRIENAGSKKGRQRVTLPKTSFLGAVMAAATGMRRGTGAGLSSGEGQHLVVGTPVERSSRISWTGTKRKMTGVGFSYVITS